MIENELRSQCWCCDVCQQWDVSQLINWCYWANY